MLIGNVTRDPELRYTPQGNAVATFGLATNRSWKTESGEVREDAEFHRLVAWNKLAELCSQLCTKGRKIYVEGRLQTRTFTGSDNLQHTITEIVIDDMILLDSKGAFANAAPAPVGPTQTAEPVVEESAQPATNGKKTKTSDKPKSDQPAPAATGTAAPTGSEDISADDIPF